MNKFYITLLLSLLGAGVYAQSSTRHAFYTSIELQVGNFWGPDLNINYVRNNFTIRAGFTGLFRKAATQPHDYEYGIELIPFGISRPKDRIENYHIAFGKIYNLNQKKTIRANLAIGVGYLQFREATNWIPRSDEPGDYSFEYQYHKEVCLYLNPKVEFPFTRKFGLTASPLFILSKHSSYVGFGIGTAFGKLRSRKSTIKPNTNN